MTDADRKELSEIKSLLQTIARDVSELKSHAEISMSADEANHALLTQILAACSGDGSGLLVEALNQLAHEVKATREAVVGRRL